MVDFVNRSETPDQLRDANISFCARYLDMPISWVKQFSVTNAGELQRQSHTDKVIFQDIFGLQNMMNAIRTVVK